MNLPKPDPLPSPIQNYLARYFRSQIVSMRSGLFHFKAGLKFFKLSITNVSEFIQLTLNGVKATIDSFKYFC